MNSPVETAQNPFEFQRFLDLVTIYRPRILEVGTWHGGTLWHWLQLASVTVSIDSLNLHPDEWQRWADQAQAELHLLHGDSHDPTIIEQARALGPYDLLFIDADHTYQAALTDWLSYSPTVRPGGMVAFHDIVERPDYGVHQLWNELKTWPGARTVEIVQAGQKPECGIGVLWTDGG